MKLSILILTIPGRHRTLDKLLSQLNKQFTDNKLIPFEDYEILIQSDVEKTIGEKRNDLLNRARGEYIAFIDDDDMISDYYIKSFIEGYDYSPDCYSLRGIITWDGQNPELFEHSIRYSAWATTENQIKYERFPNHLNFIKSSIAKQFSFQTINHGEDRDWSYQLHEAQALKKEYFIDKIIYNYQYIQNK
jgi:glycosyltransferase involved in cell wall biosynthesis